MQDEETHVPTRPSWDCLTCGQPWPCAPAKVLLSEVYTHDHSGLVIYLGMQMWDAIDDAMSKGKDGPAAIGLRDRFLEWLTPTSLASSPSQSRDPDAA